MKVNAQGSDESLAGEGIDVAGGVRDMESLGFPDGAFDAVVCVFAIFFVPDMIKQVGELWRMVRPGGQLAITTWPTAIVDVRFRG
jgi:ubiquinone/menaquinone biosynthesis C-methylase UbiE